VTALQDSQGRICLKQFLTLFNNDLSQIYGKPNVTLEDMIKIPTTHETLANSMRWFWQDDINQWIPNAQPTRGDFFSAIVKGQLGFSAEDAKLFREKYYPLIVKVFPLIGETTLMSVHTLMKMGLLEFLPTGTRYTMQSLTGNNEILFKLEDNRAITVDYVVECLGFETKVENSDSAYLKTALKLGRIREFAPVFTNLSSKQEAINLGGVDITAPDYLLYDCKGNIMRRITYTGLGVEMKRFHEGIGFLVAAAQATVNHAVKFIKQENKNECNVAPLGLL
jgi:hypothetical protein